jgi:predicted aspartyl protease
VTIISGKKIMLMCNITAAALLFLGSISDQRTSERNNDGIPVGSDLLVIPLKNAGRLFMIEAEIDNEKGNLIFDTGAGEIVLNTTYFRKYLSKNAPESRGITGSVGKTASIRTENMNISGLRFSGVQAKLSDLSHIENRRGIKVLGLIGFGLLRNYEVVIDAVNNELLLYRIDSKGERASESNLFRSDHTQKFVEINNIVFVSGQVDGKVLRFCLDTGAETNVIDRYSPKTVLETFTIERSTGLSGASSARAEVLVGTMNDFRLGNNQFRDMKTIITSLNTMSEAYGIETDGMLGYDFFISGTICINFIKRQFDIQINRKEQR